MKRLRILVCGGRTFGYIAAAWAKNKKMIDQEAYDLFFGVLDRYLENKYNLGFIISGGTLGADALADEWASEREVPFMRFPAQWTKHGKSAGPRRNQQMIDIR